MLSEAKHLCIDFECVIRFFAMLRMTINRSPLIIECQDDRFRTFSSHLKHFFIEIFAFYNKTLYFCIRKPSLQNESKQNSCYLF